MQKAIVQYDRDFERSDSEKRLSEKKWPLDIENRLVSALTTISARIGNW
jgi:hypothetical protein